MRTRTLGLTALVVAGAGVGYGVFAVRRRILRSLNALNTATATETVSLDASDPEAAVAQLNALVGKFLPGFAGLDASSLEFEDEPHTVGEVRAEAAFIELLHKGAWPLTDDTALDVDDDGNFKVEVETPIGVVTLVETERGYRVAKFVETGGKVHEDLAFENDIEDGVDYVTFAAFMALPDPEESETSIKVPLDTV